jgi:hypothetical protein
MNGHKDFAAGSSLQTRLPRVEEEDEGSGSASSSEYSDAPSRGEYAHEDVSEELPESNPKPTYSTDFAGWKGKGIHPSLRGEDSRVRATKPVTKKKESRTWSDLEWSMIIALVSPVGNWLTGSDHVKHLFLLLLLIFYLHQLVEGQLFFTKTHISSP